MDAWIATVNIRLREGSTMEDARKEVAEWYGEAEEARMSDAEIISAICGDALHDMMMSSSCETVETTDFSVRDAKEE